MVSLTDIAPSTRVVPVDGVPVSVFGVSALGVAALLTDFPGLKDLITGGRAAFNAKTMETVAPGAVAAIIAAGCGQPGQADAIMAASRLPIGTQLEFLNVIIELTMPDGLGPFMEALDGIVTRLDFGNHGKVPVSKSPLPSNAS